MNAICPHVLEAAPSDWWIRWPANQQPFPRPSGAAMRPAGGVKRWLPTVQSLGAQLSAAGCSGFAVRHCVLLAPTPMR